MRAIDEKGKHLGLMPIEKALILAKEKGLDVIEIAPQAKPVVVKIASFDKFRYRKEKELKKQFLSQKKTQQLKHVKITPRAALNDLKTKASQAEKFLEQGYKIEINLYFRGREMRNKEWGLSKLNQFLELFSQPFKIIMPAKMIGRNYRIQISKK